MSTDAFFKFPTMIRRLHAGPLRVHIDEYVALLQEQGIHVSQLACTCKSSPTSVVGYSGESSVSVISMLRRCDTTFVVAAAL